MSEQVKSQIKHLPMLQKTIEAPTGVFPPLRSKPVGSNGAGMSVLTNYLFMIEFTLACLTLRPAFLKQERG